jgi:hypothetical protein
MLRLALKPCPFCSSDQLDEKTHSQELQGKTFFQGFVECDDCGARGPQTAWYESNDGALKWLRNMHDEEGWNDRG